MKNRHYSRHHRGSKNPSRRNKNHRNYHPLGFNNSNTPPEQITELNFNANASVRVNEVVNMSKYKLGQVYKQPVHAQERPLKLATRIPATTRKQVRSVRQQEFKPAFQLVFQPTALNGIVEGNETKTPKTPKSIRRPFRTSNMPNTPNPANSGNLIFGKW